MAGVAATLAACAPTVEFATTLPVAPGVTLSLTAASGYRGTAEFRCRGTMPVWITITGNETSITLVYGDTTTILDGGPYGYAGLGQTVEFEPGYNELEWIGPAGERACRG